MAKIQHEEGKCPFCGSEDIEITNDELAMPDGYKEEYECNKCKSKFMFWYTLEFDNAYDEDGEEITKLP